MTSIDDAAPPAAPTPEPSAGARPAPAAPLPDRSPDVSVVIPARDEGENLVGLVDEIVAALASRLHEIIVIDDASTDDTPAVLARLAARLPQLVVIRHRVGSGQSAAVRSGVIAARGAVIVTIDGDGQNDPAYIPALIDHLLAGGPAVGIAAGQRLQRKDGTAKTLASRFANRLRGAILKDGTRDSGCGLKAVHRDLFRILPFFDGWHRYLPALVIREGYRVVHLEVVDRPRRFGKSKYGILDRGLRGILDLFGAWWLLKRARPIRATRFDETP